jgi:hypothetical protein
MLQGSRCSLLTVCYYVLMRLIQECAKNGGWQEVEVPSSDGEGFYLVTLPPWDRTSSEAVCECQSYEYRGKCRHQHEALGMVCSWTELDGKPQEKKNTCPECGGPTRTVVVG